MFNSSLFFNKYFNTVISYYSTEYIHCPLCGGDSTVFIQMTTNNAWHIKCISCLFSGDCFDWEVKFKEPEFVSKYMKADYALELANDQFSIRRVKMISTLHDIGYYNKDHQNKTLLLLTDKELQDLCDKYGIIHRYAYNSKKKRITDTQYIVTIPLYSTAYKCTGFAVLLSNYNWMYLKCEYLKNPSNIFTKRVAGFKEQTYSIFTNNISDYIKICNKLDQTSLSELDVNCVVNSSSSIANKLSKVTNAIYTVSLAKEHDNYLRNSNYKIPIKYCEDVSLYNYQYLITKGSAFPKYAYLRMPVNIDKLQAIYSFSVIKGNMCATKRPKYLKTPVAQQISVGIFYLERRDGNYYLTVSSESVTLVDILIPSISLFRKASYINSLIHTLLLKKKVKKTPTLLAWWQKHDILNNLLIISTITKEHFNENNYRKKLVRG